MFRETLLESSPMARKNKRWPMAAALTVELMIAGILITVPLLSTGVLPVLARTPIYTPLKPVPIDQPVHTGTTSSSGNTSSIPRTTVVLLASNNLNQLHLGPPRQTTTDPADPNLGIGSPTNQLVNLIERDGPGVRPGPGPGPGTRVRVSVLSEARLLNRVEPVYPKFATLTGIRGEVKLHAIIARDGTIQSLNVTSGHPILAAAAVEAVKQWRYQPYILNGDPVEVDTFITVNFKRAGE